MSEPGPESIPTSADPRSKRPVKRRAVTPHGEQASQIEHLFRDPTKDIKLPQTSKPRTALSLAPPPEIVANVQGSSAGAGSGEFHVYKASRRREYERLRLMQEEVDREKNESEWARKMEQTRRKDEEKTEKNRKRREKRNAAKRGKKNGEASSLDNDKGPDFMEATESAKGAPNGPGGGNDGGQTEAVETPGIIIHED